MCVRITIAIHVSIIYDTPQFSIILLFSQHSNHFSALLVPMAPTQRGQKLLFALIIKITYNGRYNIIFEA